MTRTIALLVASNLFMTIAWYGHLRFKEVDLWKVVLISWGIALFEYCLQVPANRWGHGLMTVFQLKVLQEVITLVIFVGFAAAWLGETPTWRHLISALLLIAAVAVAFSGGAPPPTPAQ
jgi:uncharacterized protein (DUF486 family)